MTLPYAYERCSGIDDFAALPTQAMVRAFDVDYAFLAGPKGDHFYFTPFGWPWRNSLQPNQWFDDQQYAIRGHRLRRSTGHVYRVTSTGDRPIELVIKISRLAQDVPLAVADGASSLVDSTQLPRACFNNPFEEIGLLMELRQGLFGPPNIRIRTKRPLPDY
ncbi:MAG: hypothetical protein HC898_01590, partial [Phycisphaerales bacterium]|nr:hypothetical protein [Phycisphaerales bacterium]